MQCYSTQDCILQSENKNCWGSTTTDAVPFICPVNSHILTHPNSAHCLVHTTDPSHSGLLCLLQEDMGHRELCIVHLVEEHARERSEKGYRLPHEEESITARS